MNTLRKTFWHNESGLASIELGLIAPVLIFSLIFAGNIAFRIQHEQKLAAAAYAGVNYLQDQVAAAGVGALRPRVDPETGQPMNASAVEVARRIIEDAYGSNIDISGIVIDTYCGCPQRNADFRNGFDEEEPFYSRTEMTTNTSQDVCPANCPDSSKSRVIASIDIEHTARDLFGNEERITERVVTRLR